MRVLILALGTLAFSACGVAAAADAGSAAAKAAKAEKPNVDWSQWGGSSVRNNTPVGHDIPTEWEVGDIDFRTGEWDPKSGKNIKWVSRLGSQTYGNPVVSGGKIFVGSNNGGGWIERYPFDYDLGVLLCFDIKDGKFLWQHSNEKLPTGRVHDWPEQGVCSAALVEGDRLYYVTNRGVVTCLDTEGFLDGENDGDVKNEEEKAKARVEVIKKSNDKNKDAIANYDMKKEADVVWEFDMMKELGVSQHNMASCSITDAGDLLFVCTSNGVDVEHNYIPAVDAPSFFVMDKKTRKILWTDNSPGANILHGQWSSPAYAVLGGVPQLLFAGGDGWLRSFAPEGDGKGNAKLLWKFDANPKTSFYTVSGRATRNHLIGTPVICDGLVYIAVGEDPEHGVGVGHLWCIDPTKKLDGSDVSPELAFNSADPTTPIPHKRLQAVDEKVGDFARPNPNSAAVWHYGEQDSNGDGKIDFEETMHRTVGSAVVKDGILYIADFSGLFHCLDAKTGRVNWTYDMLSASWGSPLVVEGKVYVGDEDGDVAIFRHSADPHVAMKDEGGSMVPYYGEINMGSSVYTTPIIADNVLYIANKSHLFAIENQKEGE